MSVNKPRNAPHSPPTDPVLTQRYPLITPLQAFELLRKLDEQHGKRVQASAGWTNADLDVREALAKHVAFFLVGKKVTSP